MEITVYGQLIQAVWAIAVGFIAGFLYDFLRAVRRRIRLSLIAVVADSVFWVIVGLAVFVMGMVIGQGEVRLFMVICMMCAAALYFAAVSKLTLGVCNFLLDLFIKLLTLIAFPFVFLGKKAKKLFRILKKPFQKLKECVTMKLRKLFGTRKRQETENDPPGDEWIESQKGKYFYEGRGHSAHRLRDGESDQPAQPDPERRGAPREPSAAGRRRQRRERRQRI